MPKAIVRDLRLPPPTRPAIAWERTVIYEAQVRALTRLHPDVPDEIRGTFAALAWPAVIDRLQRLGITTLELLPAAAWIDERHLPPLGLTNAWGYNPVALMAPDPRLAPGGWAEVRGAVDTLAAAGIETIVDVVFNHTGEGDALGPTVSMRGLDNTAYYRLDPLRPARYLNDAGTGNTLGRGPTPRPAPRHGRPARLAAAGRRGRLPFRSVDDAGARSGRLRRRGAAAGGDRPGSRATRPQADRRALGLRSRRLPARALSAGLGRMERPLPRHGAWFSGAAIR